MPPLNLMLTWLAVIVGAYLLLFWVASWWARRTPSDIDDVVVGVLQKPVVLILVLYAAINLSAASDLDAAAKAAVDRGTHILLVGVVSWGVWHLLRDTVLYYGRQLALRTESNFDDVLLPVLDVLAPVIIIVTGAILMLRLLGADISTVIMTAGGAALVVGLTLRDTLGNILGGLMLLIDTPFRFGDLVLWDNTVCQIKRIGLRVTTLYNSEDHSDIFLPNTTLAAAKLTNLTRPSPDLRVPIDVTISDTSFLAQAQTTLRDVADMNPYVLGDLPAKLRVMQEAFKAADPASALGQELRWGIVAIRRELRVDRRLAGMLRLLDNLLKTIHTQEKGGLSAQELVVIAQQMVRLDAYDERLKTAVRLWARTRARDPQLRRFPEDRARLLSDAEGRLTAYEERLAHLVNHLKQPGLYEAQRLDDEVVAFREWLPQMFKPVTPAWKYPLVSIMQVGSGGAQLRLWVYVDDIHLEGFLRRQRVVTALRQAAAVRLQGLAKA